METISNHRISIIIIALLILSWWGILDSLSIIVNTESIKDAAIIYGVARSINGVISVVQSAEISALVGSVHPGELLDPMNDLIERFSTVMSWSLGSLVLQKVLLAVFSSYSFKVIFTLFCVITLCVIHFGNSLTLKNKLWTIFAIVASLRFSIAIICGLTSIVDYGFIQKIEQESLRTVQSFSTDISAGIIDGETSQETIELQLRILEDQKAELANLTNILELENDELKSVLEELDKPSVLDRVRGQNKSSQQLEIEQKMSNNETRIEEALSQIELLEDQITCLQLKGQGEECGNTWSAIKSMFSAEKINDISAKLNSTINDLITVLVSLILTTIIIPILFLLIAWKFTRFLIASYIAAKKDHSILALNSNVSAANENGMD